MVVTFVINLVNAKSAKAPKLVLLFFALTNFLTNFQRKFARKLSTPPRKFACKLSTSPRKFAGKVSTSLASLNVNLHHHLPANACVRVQGRKFACKLSTPPRKFSRKLSTPPCKRIVADTSKSQFYLMFLAIEAHLVRTILLQYLQYLQFLAIEPHFVRKGCAAELVKSQFYISFWRSNLVSCEMVVDTSKSQFYITVLAICSVSSNW